MEHSTLFVDVVLPLPLPLAYTYRVPNVFNQRIGEGVRVLVSFGKKKIITGVVEQVHNRPPKHYEAKYILDVLDEKPTVGKKQFELYRRMADYYLCTLGEVMNAALPSSLKLHADSKIILNEGAEFNTELLSEQELQLIELLKERKNLSLKEIEKFSGKNVFYKIIKSLTEKSYILIINEIKEKYKPKYIRKIKLKKSHADSEETLKSLIDLLEKTPKQLNVLLAYLREVPVFRNRSSNDAGMERQHLIKQGISSSSLETLIKKGIFEAFDSLFIGRSAEAPDPTSSIPLSTLQQEARDSVLDLFQEKDTVLLHGVTGSGKTEIYIDLIQKALQSGSQVLYLLPEIALTTQIMRRLEKVFGSQAVVWHSALSDRERAEIWNDLRDGKINFITGVRSAVFLPFDRLGLIVVDEEQENSYKQQSPAPRYHAVSTALFMAGIHGAKTLLGSATPSLETYFHCKSGKYGLVTLKERFGNSVLPNIISVDISKERKERRMNGEFSHTLLEALNECLRRSDQAVLFKNRRGYAPYIICDTCEWIPTCENCSISLTYHLHEKRLKCHYCGYRISLPHQCYACGSDTLNTVGFGTEKIEDRLKELLPKTRILRMDSDMVKSKRRYEEVIAAFEQGKADILVGTGMVGKGLDFDRVSLVGIFDVDSSLHFPDFRAEEKVFRTVVQVSGRAGRRETPGTVIIQTRHPQHPILQIAFEGDYDRFYEFEIVERKKFGYPPFTRITTITCKHPDPHKTEHAASELAAELTKQLTDSKVLGPEKPPVDKIKGLYLQEITIKSDRFKENMTFVKKQIAKAEQILKSNPLTKGVTIVIDVDPL